MADHQSLATVVLVTKDGTVAVTRLASDHGADLSTVELVARMALAARRSDHRLRLEEVSPWLVRLLDLAGLAEVVGVASRDAGTDDCGPDRTSYRYRYEGVTMAAPKPTIQVKRVHTIGVPVTDQDRALQFYVGTLGLESRLDVPIGGGRRWIEVAPPDGTATLSLVAASEKVPTGVETGIRLSSADVAVAHAALRTAGVDADDILRWEGVPPMFAFRDQDGNGLELVEEV
jgi:catechol 2,3-dioxygenase-like lactoylglutathione lyase family enzyme